MFYLFFIHSFLDKRSILKLLMGAASVIFWAGGVAEAQLSRPLSYYESLSPTAYVKLPTALRLKVRKEIRKDIKRHLSDYIGMNENELGKLPWLRKGMVEGMQENRLQARGVLSSTEAVGSYTAHAVTESVSTSSWEENVQTALEKGKQVEGPVVIIRDPASIASQYALYQNQVSPHLQNADVFFSGWDAES